jgi:NAD(P)-dependent dehydrogenase (short-subunit alcohol dehydrogenase family)
MLNPEGRVVMISGATGGIGRAVLERLLVAGYTVSAGVRDVGRLPANPALSAHAYEATSIGAAEAWVAATMARHGRIDALVNAAGINPRGMLLDPDEAPFDRMWAVNAKGPMRIIRAAWPHLAAGGQGRVVNLASLSGTRVRNDNLGYAMSKFAVMALTQEVRRAGWEHGIRATAVCPGFVDTGMTSHVTKVQHDQMSRPEDVAALVEVVFGLSNTASVAELLVNCRHEDML